MRRIIPAGFLIAIQCVSVMACAQSSEAPSRTATPKRAVVWMKGDSVMVGNTPGTGTEAMDELFGFDESARKAFPAGGSMTTTLHDNPVPIEFQLGSPVSGTMWGRYSNIVLDFRSLDPDTLKTFPLGEEKTIDADESCGIRLIRGTATELFVSPDYVVFPDQLRTVRQGGPFAQLAFSSDRADSIPAGSVLAVSRNGKEIWRGRFQQARSQPVELTLVKRANDVVEWRIQDAAGKVTHRGQVAFPVAAAVPHTVEYLITVDNHPALPDSAKPSTLVAAGRPAARESNLQVAASVQEKKLIHRVEPVYPALARQARIQGDVQFEATIAKDGSVKQLVLVQGSPLLSGAASDAVKQWVYQPTLANGQTVEVDTQITVSFKLDEPK